MLILSVWVRSDAEQFFVDDKAQFSCYYIQTQLLLHWWYDVLLPDGTKPLPEAIWLIICQVRSVSTWGQVSFLDLSLNIIKLRLQLHLLGAYELITTQQNTKSQQNTNKVWTVYKYLAIYCSRMWPKCHSIHVTTFVRTIIGNSSSTKISWNIVSL